MRRARIELAELAAWPNLAEAATRAAKGKHIRPEVQAFFAHYADSLAALRTAVLSLNVPLGGFRAFRIHDPKSRIIHAAGFPDRVLHHAIMNLAGPVIERSMADSSYACRPGKGALAAVQSVQQSMRRYGWYVQVDIRGYFDHIDHALLLDLLARRFKGPDFLSLMEKLIRAYQVTPGKGLPIGALSSQYFANLYLDGADRFLMEQCGARAAQRYMDDIIWWCDSRGEAKQQLARLQTWLKAERALEIKPQWRMNRAVHGALFCGYRILPGQLRLSARRKRAYSRRRRFWEQSDNAGLINAMQLQSAYAAVKAITDHADATGWRRGELLRRPDCSRQAGEQC